MTRQEVRALIDAKIKGQGTNVDAGSVLPAILNGILDLIDSGGGGGTSDAVQYIPQELTESQQMQARKNQGLYYEEEETLAGVISWDGNTEGKESIDLGGILAYKVANFPKDIPQDAWLGYTSTEELETTPFTQIVDYGQTMPGAEGKMLLGAISGGGVVIVADQFSMDADGTTIEADGIYFTLNARSFSYDAYDGEVHQIPAKYIPNVGAPAVKMEVPSMGNAVYYNMAQINVNQYVPSRDVVFSVEGHTVVYAYAFDVINGGTNGQEGDTLTFSSGGLYWVQLELAAGSTYPYVCAMVFVESDNQ